MNRLSKEAATMAVVASTYSILTVVLGDLSYSWLQIRISEALAPLPFFLGFPSVVGLTLGCSIANLFSPVGLVDIILGPLATFIAALLSWKAHLGRKLLACIYPVLVNGLLVSFYISMFFDVPYVTSVATISAGEFIAAVLLGYPVLQAIETRIRRK